MKCLLLLLLTIPSSLAQVPYEDMQKITSAFSDLLLQVTSSPMALRPIKIGYIFTIPRIRPLNGTSLLLKVKDLLQEIFNNRLNAIQNLTDVAERTYASYRYNPELEYDYPRSKKLPANFGLIKHPLFPGIQVNFNRSAVQVPTNIFDDAPYIVNGAKWSSVLDEVFVQNRLSSPTINLQYFCSSDGFFRSFPGSSFTNGSNYKSFDCRTRKWYVRAGTSAKDMVILLDVSGSMKGLKIETARNTARSILQMLNEDDYFNVILFSDTPSYLEPCYNGSLIQATSSYRKHISDLLGEKLDTHNIADFTQAFTTAFQLFEKAEKLGLGSGCNKMIMLITDGTTSEYQEVFEKYNNHQTVRVFSYLIGRQVVDKTYLRKIACNNKGFFNQITTLADIHEHVQTFIQVLGRPLVMDRVRRYAWTSIYTDAINVNKLTTTLAVPVYDTRNRSYEAGNLLGVMGTDIDLSVLKNTLPHHQLGVHSYAFAITNNGYVLFHPDHRPFYNGKLKENYNSVDLSEVEFVDDGNESADKRTFYLPLRRRMVDRDRGVMRLRTRVVEDSRRRVSIRNVTFYFIPMIYTPFSLGVAVPDGLSENFLDGTIRVARANLKNLKHPFTKIAPWQYCSPENDEDSKLASFDLLLKYLDIGKKDYNFFKTHCYTDLVESLLFDAEATRHVVAAWEDFAPKNQFVCYKLGCFEPPEDSIEQAFIGTKAGLTRYFNFTANLTVPFFVDNNTETNVMPYYTKAIENGDGNLTISVPFFQDRKEVNDTVVTISTPVIISIGNKQAAAGVVGLQMKYRAFRDYFLQADRQCLLKEQCSMSCEDETIDCYLIDDNGYIILSEQPQEHVGRFFGEIEGVLVDELSTSDVTDDSSLFRKVSMLDFQATCQRWEDDNAKADASTLFEPMSHLMKAVLWVLKRMLTMATFLSTICVYTFDEIVEGQEQLEDSMGSNSTIHDKEVSIEDENDKDEKERVEEEEEEAEEESLTKNDLKKLFLLSKNNSNLYHSRLNMYRSMLLEGKSKKTIKTWYNTLLANLTSPDYESLCIKRQYLYVTQKEALSTLPWVKSLCQACAECQQPMNYSIHRVSKTNLLHVAIQRPCQCHKSISLTSQEVITRKNGECDVLMMYRQKPSKCHSYHPDDNSEHCDGWRLKADVTIVLFFFLISICLK